MDRTVRKYGYKEEMDHNETIMDSGHLARSTVFPTLVIMIV